MVKKQVKKEKEQYDNCCCKEDKSPFIAVPASLGGIYLVVVALFLIFAKENADLLVDIAWAFVVMCLSGVLFAYWSMKIDRKK